MKRHLAVRLLLIGSGALAVPAGLIGVRPIEVELDSYSPLSDKPQTRVTVLPSDSLGLSIIEHDLFRLSRSPAEVAFSLVPPEPVYVEPPPPKPQLVLSGIVWGEEPSALVEGLPGVEGVRLMRVGDSSGAIKLKRVTRTDATLVGMDTTWVLQVRKPW